MSETICINKKLWDQTRALLEERKIAINALEKVVTEHGKTIGEQRNELADQRRTMATLRARMQRGPMGRHFRNHGPIKWQSFDPLAFGYSQCYQISEVKLLHEKRIAAIRNFGSLP